MRIGTQFAMEQGMQAMSERQRAMIQAQNQIATGKRFSTAGEDPLAAAQAERARAETVRIAADQRSLDLGKHVLSLADTALGDATNILQAARDTLVQAGDGAYTDSERQQLAVQLKNLRSELFNVANRDDGAGAFIFGGQGTNGTPFSDNGVAVSYNGVSGLQQVGLPPSVISALDGREFMTIKSGNGLFSAASAAANTGKGWVDAGEVSDVTALTGHDYRIDVRTGTSGLVYDVTDVTAGATLSTGTPFVAGADIAFDGLRVRVSGTPANGDSYTVTPSANKSVFKVLDDAITLLQTPMAGTPNKLAEGLSRSLGEVDSSMSRMLQMRTTAGEQLRRIDVETDTLDARNTAEKISLSELQDTDMATAVSELTRHQTALQAAMQSYAQVSKLKLMDYL